MEQELVDADHAGLVGPLAAPPPGSSRRCGRSCSRRGGTAARSAAGPPGAVPDRVRVLRRDHAEPPAELDQVAVALARRAAARGSSRWVSSSWLPGTQITVAKRSRSEPSAHSTSAGAVGDVAADDQPVGLGLRLRSLDDLAVLRVVDVQVADREQRSGRSPAHAPDRSRPPRSEQPSAEARRARVWRGSITSSTKPPAAADLGTEVLARVGGGQRLPLGIRVCGGGAARGGG